MRRSACCLATLGVALFGASALAQQVPQFTILPFAGAPNDNGDNGPAIGALLNSPHGVTVDGAGNIYIADTSDNLLRRISNGGTIVTLTSQLLFPWHAAASPAGDIYVADAANNRIVRISAGGVASNFAGTGIAGNSGVPGPALNAQLNSPRDVAVDSTGNVFVLDSGNNRVLKITPDGRIALFAGTGSAGYHGDGGSATQALLNFPYGITLDAAGDVFISDSLNQRIRAVTPDGNIDTIAGTNARGYNGDNGPLGTAFNYPSGLAVDSSGALYIADTENNLVRKMTQPLTSNARITTIAGTGVGGFSGDRGPARSAWLNYPRGVAVDAQGDVLIADSQNNRVRRIDPQGIITTVAGADHGSGDGGPAALARLFAPSGIALDAAGDAYIADSLNNRVRRVDASGTISDFAGTGTAAFGGDSLQPTAAYLNGPNGLSFDRSGALYISDSENHVVRKVSNGIISTVAGIGGQSGNDGDEGPATQAHLYHPNAIAFDAAGNMYIADSGNNRVRVVTINGNIHNFAGDGRQGLPGYDGDGGLAASAHLNYPRSLALDANGNIYIADFFNNVVRKVLAGAGVISTVAGGTGELALPAGLAFDNLGNLYVADSLNHRIRVLGADGALHSVAGVGTSGDAGDGGPALAAAIASPWDLAIDAKGVVYFSDQDNNRVRKLVPGQVSIAGIVNAAALTGSTAAPGEMVTIYGSQLAPAGLATVVPASTLALENTAANTQVFFDGIPAPLLYISPGQINAIVPYEVAGRSSTNVTVVSDGRHSNAFTITIVAAAPGIFVNSQGAVLNQNGSPNTPSNPAHPGEIVTLFATGEGQTNPPGMTGRLVQGALLPAPALPVVLQIGSQTAQLPYAGEMPQGAGVLQINAVVPANAPYGDQIPVTLTVGAAAAQSGVTMSIR